MANTKKYFKLSAAIEAGLANSDVTLFDHPASFLLRPFQGQN
jgi:hypothetical protein